MINSVPQANLKIFQKFIGVKSPYHLLAATVQGLECLCCPLIKLLKRAPWKGKRMQKRECSENPDHALIIKNINMLKYQPKEPIYNFKTY